MKTDVAVTLIKPPAVRQAELQEVIDLQNRIEILAADIRRRLESGASRAAPWARVRRARTFSGTQKTAESARLGTWMSSVLRSV